MTSSVNLWPGRLLSKLGLRIGRDSLQGSSYGCDPSSDAAPCEPADARSSTVHGLTQIHADFISPPISRITPIPTFSEDNAGYTTTAYDAGEGYQAPEVRFAAGAAAEAHRLANRSNRCNRRIRAWTRPSVWRFVHHAAMGTIDDLLQGELKQRTEVSS